MKESCDCCREADDAPCGCCESNAATTPLPLYNRPGLGQLAYRIGTHGAFLESMKARLPGFYLERPDAEGKPVKTYPLAQLTTRDANDPALALLDAWATVADVLTFYQERIANENYLRTATERRSIVELAALVGYKPRPGVAASVYLAYTLEANSTEEVVIPAGSRAQSMPGPGEMPQPFETSEDLKARAIWNNLKPRLSRPQTQAAINASQALYLQGTSTGLSKNDVLLIDYGVTREPRRIADVLADNAAGRTRVDFANTPASAFTSVNIGNVIRELVRPASLQPANALRLRKDLRRQFAVQAPAEYLLENTAVINAQSSGMTIRPTAQAGYAVLGAFSSSLSQHLGNADASIRQSPNPLRAFAFRALASLFGHNAPIAPAYADGTIEPRSNWMEWTVNAAPISDMEAADTLYLDRAYKEVAVGDFIGVQRYGAAIPEIFTVKTVQTISRSAYGISGETTRITLNSAWWNPNSASFRDIRTAKVYVQPEALALAEEPITAPVCGGTDDLIELDGFYEGFDAGRWVIVSGERDIEGTRGVRFSELALLAAVTQDVAATLMISTGNTGPQGPQGPMSVPLPGETRHTFIRLAEKLAYCFKRDTVAIHGNVVKATHGETRKEVLGGGNGGKALQKFMLKQAPLTYVSAPNPSGIDSTLKVFVNNLEWQEADTLAGLSASARRFTTRTGDDAKTTLIFGNGSQGARLPTGMENVRAEYRSGIGKSGNVKAEQISLLLSKPLGVKEVINPLRAAGGADRETRDQARGNVPLAIKALDRLVSTQDYQDFCRVYAGIGKAYAIELSDGRQSLVHVTIAGAGDSPIDVNSDLYRNLRKSLHDFGDPYQKIRLAVRELLLIVIEAGISILPDYRWEPVVSAVRAALLDAFSFERRELGQDVVLSEVISVMQAVPGVSYVDVNAFGGVPEKQPLTDEEINQETQGGEVPLTESRRLLTPDEIADEVGKVIDRSQGLPENAQQLANRRVRQRIVVNVPIQERYLRPAQLAFLSPDVPATLILNQIP